MWVLSGEVTPRVLASPVKSATVVLDLRRGERGNFAPARLLVGDADAS
jgi:hypothetical protein